LGLLFDLTDFRKLVVGRLFVKNEPRVAKKHTIACIKHPNGTLTAEENTVYVPSLLSG